jgi:hypothetical protein
LTVRADLDSHGFAQLHASADAVRDAMVAPFEAAARFLGEPPLFVERQHIRVVEGGKSIASTSGEAPLHTDSQMILGVPATVQILVCVRPAPRGGETVLVDAFPVVEQIGDASLFDESITQPFYFGDVRGPMVALRGGHLTVTLAPATRGRFRDALHGATRALFALKENDVLVASNHRMVHGRTAFDASSNRELVRLLVWLERPLAAPPSIVSRAREVASNALATKRVQAVTWLLRGVPPARITRELGIGEAELYALRDRCLCSLLSPQ